ncbi:hypothetical protein D9611_012299 [Ephemerocybe angulata]|uniref:Uncharacterized protein n=1 Tax=Ephemerocybe angulata TaxID=980116 RepID=A0A8H5ESI0_9AGAR|nr:hypothetical protein D9611_012299 [Tulosesus angulatus]
MVQRDASAHDSERRSPALASFGCSGSSRAFPRFLSFPPFRASLDPLQPRSLPDSLGPWAARHGFQAQMPPSETADTRHLPLSTPRTRPHARILAPPTSRSNCTGRYIYDNYRDGNTLLHKRGGLKSPGHRFQVRNTTTCAESKLKSSRVPLERDMSSNESATSQVYDASRRKSKPRGEGERWLRGWSPEPRLRIAQQSDCEDAHRTASSSREIPQSFHILASDPRFRFQASLTTRGPFHTTNTTGARKQVSNKLKKRVSQLTSPYPTAAVTGELKKRKEATTIPEPHQLGPPATRTRRSRRPHREAEPRGSSIRMMLPRPTFSPTAPSKPTTPTIREDNERVLARRANPALNTNDSPPPRSH